MNQADQAILDSIIRDAEKLLKRCEEHGLAWSAVNMSVVLDGLAQVTSLSEPMTNDGSFERGNGY